MTSKLFFSYYLIALKEALSQDNVNSGFLVKSPNWFYPKDMYDVLAEFEESHYDEFPFIEKVAYYFDAKSHRFSNVRGVDINSYRNMLIETAKDISLKFGITI